MEEQYWKHFTETGNVSDYLDYKMEVYGHSGMVQKPEESEKGEKADVWYNSHTKSRCQR